MCREHVQCTCHTSHYSITSPRREVADWIFGEADSEVANLDLDVNRTDLEVNRADLDVNRTDLEVNGAHGAEPEEVGGGPLGTSKD